MVNWKCVLKLCKCMPMRKCGPIIMWFINNNLIYALNEGRYVYLQYTVRQLCCGSSCTSVYKCEWQRFTRRMHDSLGSCIIFLVVLFVYHCIWNLCDSPCLSANHCSVTCHVLCFLWTLERVADAFATNKQAVMCVPMFIVLVVLVVTVCTLGPV